MADRTLRVEIVGDASSLQKTFGKAAAAGDGLGKSFTRLAKTAAVAGVALGGAVAIGLTKSINAASDLTEQINKANVVFRGSEKEVISWSKGLAQSFGLSQRAALEAAGTFGNMLVPMGFARDRAAEMSERMVELAGDMASFNNASPEATLDAIRAGLAGETEPLRRFGVFLSAARVQEEALAETHKKSAKELTQAEKATAAYNIILKDTQDTQGDFARSAGGSVANQIRIMKAQFENAAASVGQVFLPAVISVLSFVNQKLIPGLTNAVGAIRDFWKNTSSELSKAPTFQAKMQVVFSNVKDLAGKFVDEVVGAITSLLPQKPVVFNPQIQVHRGGTAGTTGGGVDWNAVAADMIAALSLALQQSADLAKSIATTITEAIRKVNWAQAGAAMGPGLASAMAVAIKTALDPVFWIKNWELALAIASVVFGGAIGRAAGAIAAKFAPAMVGVVAKVSPAFAAAMGRMMEDAGRAFVAVLARVGPMFTSLMSRIFGKLAGLAIVTIKVLGITAAINAITDFVSAAIQKLKELLSKIPELGYQIGADLVRGIGNGIAGLTGWLLGQAGSLVSKVKDKLEFWKSPPDEYGRWIGGLLTGGMGKGLAEGAPAVAKAAAEVVQKAKDALESASNDFASAFSALADVATQAFDAKMAAWTPKSQRILDKMQLQDQIKSEKQAIADAQAELTAAQAAATQEATAENIKRVQDAEAAVAAARRAQKEAQLARDAAQEQEHHDKQVARDKLHFQDRLTRLQGELAAMTKSGGELTAKESAKFRAKLNDLLKDYGIDARFWGTAIGISLADGLNQAKGVVAKAARQLARMIQAYLKVSSPTEEGPMADLDKWWAGLVPTLLSGINLNDVRDAGAGIATALGAGIGTGGTGALNFDDILKLRGTVVTGAKDITESFTSIGKSKDALGDNIQDFSETAAGNFTKVADSTRQVETTATAVFPDVAKTLVKGAKDSANPLAFLAYMLDNVTESMKALRFYAYELRDGLRDTIGEIGTLLGGAGVAGNIATLKGRALGGPVNAGQAYRVGETGPEIFVPSVAGTILSSSAGGGGSEINLNFYGTTIGTSREFQDVIRRALYDVQRRNPGTGL